MASEIRQVTSESIRAAREQQRKERLEVERVTGTAISDEGFVVRVPPLSLRRDTQDKGAVH